MSRAEQLNDEQWKLIEALLPKVGRVDGCGRPRIEDRAVLNGIFWVLRTGAAWADLPRRFPSYQTCHRRFQEWVSSGVFNSILETLAEDLRSRGKLDLSECFIDGTFVVAKKGALQWEQPSGAKVRSSWQWQTAMVFLSPYTLHLLLPTKSPLSKILLKAGLSPLPLAD
jgi:transposase